MYKITKDGATVALTEKPNYVRLQENGCFALCEEPEAQGVVHNGTVFHLLGREEMSGQETVMLEQIDAGAQIGDMQNAVDDLVIAVLEGGLENV